MQATLQIWRDMKALEFLRHGNGDTFKEVAKQMKKSGYVHLSEQVGKCWKILKKMNIDH